MIFESNIKIWLILSLVQIENILNISIIQIQLLEVLASLLTYSLSIVYLSPIILNKTKKGAR